jgi:hypothetical protein
MMPDLPDLLRSQLLASLEMLGDCLAACPDRAWGEPVAKYPVWLVAYHTLCFADFYLSSSESAWRPSPDLHPRGIEELNDEYPSRTFTQHELLRYTEFCRRKAVDSLASETPALLDGPSGFSRLPFSRAELHLYNLRHIQHHTGQLTAFLRRFGVDIRWAPRG